MFQFEWAQKNLWKKEGNPDPPASTALSTNQVEKVRLLNWMEHCVECAVPECYDSCPIYVPRADKKCALFVYGIYPNKAFQGSINCGADIRFRKWAKLETKLYDGLISCRQHQGYSKIDRCISSVVSFFSSALAFISPKRRLNGAWAVFRDKLLSRLGGSDTDSHCDDFVLECFFPEEEPLRLILEYWDEEKVRFRHAFEIVPGFNSHKVPAKDFRLNRRPSNSRLSLYPDNNAERRVIFTWLDFVKYKSAEVPPDKQAQTAQPAKKVKCVAWDLDNTLWKGILVEDGEEGLAINPEAIDLIKKLDERGIIHTVVSKNDHGQAWKVIEKCGLGDYFLYPAINWAPKSANLKQVASRLNIGIDTFALIDDSAFERAEVEASLPQVRTYSEEEICKLPGYTEFDLPVTKMSKKRRQSYLNQLQREKAKEEFTGDYEDFLRNCGMKMRIFVPSERKHVDRCLELIQRSNQLNLSTRRYTAEEFEALLSTKTMLCLGFHCKDRFGDYGIVGFLSVDEGQSIPAIVDLVISCRVVQKRVEHALFEWLAQREREKGCEALRAELIKTKRNGPLVRVFEDLQFEVLQDTKERIQMELPLGREIDTGQVVDVTDEVEA